MMARPPIEKRGLGTSSDKGRKRVPVEDGGGLTTRRRRGQRGSLWEDGESAGRTLGGTTNEDDSLGRGRHGVRTRERLSEEQLRAAPRFALVRARGRVL